MSNHARQDTQLPQSRCRSSWKAHGIDMNCQSDKDKEVSIKTYPMIDAAAARARPTLTREDHLDDQNMLVLSKDSKHDAEGIAQVLWKSNGEDSIPREILWGTWSWTEFGNTDHGNITLTINSAAAIFPKDSKNLFLPSLRFIVDWILLLRSRSPTHSSSKLCILL